ncbi:MAG TPA: leucine-rich repeat domain-containing protein [Candidatus Lokiarchaeia archaeon]|nr:leucine-rich repeat domain-containing protein [Candidatus Lokiarchaeia archaeon]
MATADFLALCREIRESPHCPACGAIIPPDQVEQGFLQCPDCGHEAAAGEQGATRGQLSFQKLVELSRAQVVRATMAHEGDIHFDPDRFVPRRDVEQLFGQFFAAIHEDPRRLFVLTGETGCGKTWVTAQWAYAIGMQGVPTFFCSLREGIGRFFKEIFGKSAAETFTQVTMAPSPSNSVIAWVFDGYDECLSDSERQATLDAILSCTNLAASEGILQIVILTGRTGDWRADPVLAGRRAEIEQAIWHVSQDEIAFQISEMPESAPLSPYSSEEITLALRNFALPSLENLSLTLQPLLSNPLWTRLAAEVYAATGQVPDGVDPVLHLRFYAHKALQPYHLISLADIGLAILQEWVDGRSIAGKMDSALHGEVSVEILRDIDLPVIKTLQGVGILQLNTYENEPMVSFTLPQFAWFAIGYRMFMLAKTDQRERLTSFLTTVDYLPERDVIYDIMRRSGADYYPASTPLEGGVLDYQGTPLVATEHAAMTELETILGVPIPSLDRVAWDVVGFVARAGHVFELNLNGQGLTELPANFGALQFLRNLSLFGNHLTILPDSICHLDQLEKLNLSSNNLTDFPENIGNLHQLERFYAANNEIAALPEGLEGLRAIKELGLHHNRITSLPESMGTLKTLQYLELSHNRLSKLPSSIGQLPALKELYLAHNRLSGIPESIGDLILLEKLTLTENSITELPGTIRKCQLLVKLSLGQNAIGSLPDGIGQLPYLSTLELGENLLESLPDSIGNLGGLLSLDLHANHLVKLPESVGNLCSLRCLDLRGNTLTMLPVSLGNLQSLNILRTSGNSQLSLPLDVLQQMTNLQFLCSGEDQGVLNHAAQRTSSYSFDTSFSVPLPVMLQAFSASRRRPISARQRTVAVILADPSRSDIVKPSSVHDEDSLYATDILKMALLELPGYDFIFLDNHDTLAADLLRLKGQFDYAFNLCDEGFHNVIRQELNIPALLETIKVPYTGATPQCIVLCFDKSIVRGAAMEMGIPVAQGIFVRQEDAKGQLPFDFPAILKPNFGDGSFGITQRNVVHSSAEFLNALAEIRSRIGPEEPLLVEEYLTGADLSVGIIGNPPGPHLVLPVTQEDYSALPPDLPQICGYEAKWLPDSPYGTVMPKPANLPPETQEFVGKCSALLFARFECQDYARFDWRLNANGEPRLLEINPNCGYTWDGHLARMSRAAGLSYCDMLGAILSAAELRFGFSPVQDN